LAYNHYYLQQRAALAEVVQQALAAMAEQRVPPRLLPQLPLQLYHFLVYQDLEQQ
jgi:hypothetical protein